MKNSKKKIIIIIATYTFDDSQASAAVTATFIFHTLGKEVLTPRFSIAQAVASLGPKKGGTGFGKDESYTAFHAGWL